MLSEYKNKVVSQNGEDGVIEEIIRRLNLTDIWCCEFGAWDGMYLSNTFHLIRTTKAKVVMIEGDSSKFPRLLWTQSKYPDQIIALNFYVDHTPNAENSLDKILSNTSIPKDFDILSIDIDSYDLDVWESLKNYLPKLVIIEINNEIEPGIFQRHSETSWLNSFTSTLEVGKSKGYTLICHLFNLFFIRNDLLDKIKIEQKYIDNPALLFNWKWVHRAEWAKQKKAKRLEKEFKRKKE
jgi:hypothetical protein